MILREKSNLDTRLFLKYLQYNGFKVNDYKKLLEISQSPEDSISKLIKDYDQFLLTFFSIDSSLEKAGIKGSIGFIKDGKIIYPDRKFLDQTAFERRKDHHDYPEISDFDVILSGKITDSAFAAATLKQPKFFGFCNDLNDKNNAFQERRAKLLLEEIIKSGQDNYEMVSETLSPDSIYSNGKRLVLIKEKVK